MHRQAEVGDAVGRHPRLRGVLGDGPADGARAVRRPEHQGLALLGPVGQHAEDGLGEHQGVAEARVGHGRPVLDDERVRGTDVGEAVRVEEPRVVRAEHGHRTVGEREVGQRVVLQVGGALVGGTVGPQRLADRADAAPRTVLDELLQRGDQARRVEAQASHVLEDHGLRVVAQRVVDEGQVGVG